MVMVIGGGVRGKGAEYNNTHFVFKKDDTFCEVGRQSNTPLYFVN